MVKNSGGHRATRLLNWLCFIKESKASTSFFNGDTNSGYS